ncbi:hypothetical protein MKW94_025697 [Papaver nudicaule]|uniref:Uncharacterized protein n=1 Tax=Papaver nudicaule TaxID=74823 RepID=A0AA41VX29_PAPNU|nr:hypothetical protein [Papaver nudicaule]
MPNPLRKSGSSLPGPKNSSQSSSSLDSSKNEDKEEEKRKKKGSKNLSAAQYRAILLQSHGREKKKNKEDKSDKKRKLILGQKAGDDSGRRVNEKTGAERKSLGSDSRSVVLEELEEGEIRANSTILLEPKQGMQRQGLQKEVSSQMSSFSPEGCTT